MSFAETSRSCTFALLGATLCLATACSGQTDRGDRDGRPSASNPQGGSGGIPEESSVADPPAAVRPAPQKRCIDEGEIVAPDPASLSGAYATTCSGCHGPEGRGIGKFPSLQQDKGFEAFVEIVRKGKEGAAGVMPSFGEAYLSEAELARIYATLVGKNLRVSRTLGCAEPRQFSDAQIETAFREGLEAWRAPDHEGAACASCHGVMPFDLAYIGYDDATIYRRALKHISDTQTRKVIDFVHAIRARYGLAGQKDALAFRPFQPGGTVLDGATVAERDHKLGLNIAQVAPTLFEGIVDTHEKAIRAKDEFLALNPRTFPIGVPLNRWTEDEHHGLAHATFNEWIPDRPRIPKDASARQALYALHDRYIETPSWENVFAIQDKLEELTVLTGVQPGPVGGKMYAGFAYGMYDLKYRSVLFAQHHFLAEATSSATLARMSAAPFPGRNALWDLADFARVSSSISFAKDCNSSWNGCMGLPDDAVAKLDPALDPRHELHRLKLSWFWVGWLFDTSLYQTSASNSTKVSEYFTGTLYEDGYYNHVVYHRIRKNLAAAYEIEHPIKDAEGQPAIDHPWAHTYGYYMGYGRGIDADKMPRDPVALSLYKTFAGNTLRMMILLATEQIVRTGKVSSKDKMLSIYDTPDSAFVRFTGLYSPDPARDEALRAAYRSAIAAACERRPLGYKEAVYPGHCDAP